MHSLTTLAAKTVQSVVRRVAMTSTHSKEACLSRLTGRLARLAVTLSMTFDIALRQEHRGENEDNGENVSEEHFKSKLSVTDEFEKAFNL